jgi:tRNA G18 (ribose-2'-O)-methylase SpoU
MAALVVGSEAAGITPELLAICDQRLCIPMQGGVTSLNVAVATGILLYEIRRQQHWFEHPD